MAFLILSAGSSMRTPAPLNHRAYADRIEAPYLFDSTPGPLPRVFFQKFAAVRRALAHSDLVFWIDDDAFMTNFDVDIRSFADPDAELVLCASPVNPEGGWTYLSSGQFLIRRTAAMLELVDAVLATDLDDVRAWWDHEQYGIFTNTDQDAFLYQLLRDDVPWAGRWRRLEWQAFNSRPYHYEHRLDEHVLCHFAVPGGRTKMELVREFAQRMGTTTALVDEALLEPYGTFIAHSGLAELLGPPWSGSSGDERVPQGTADAVGEASWRRIPRRIGRRR